MYMYIYMYNVFFLQNEDYLDALMYIYCNVWENLIQRLIKCWAEESTVLDN